MAGLQAKRPRAAALITYTTTHQQNVLLMRRVKAGREYYTLPGGSLEAGETPETACLREVCEETGLILAALEPLVVLENQGRLEHYFLAATEEAALVLGEPEASRQSPDNIYSPLWVTRADALTLNVLPAAVLGFIKTAL